MSQGNCQPLSGNGVTNSKVFEKEVNIYHCFQEQVWSYRQTLKERG